jgi:hypothetical protein
MEFHHVSVLLNECIDNLNIKPDGVYVDCTMGGAGHSKEIVKRLSKDGLFIGFDQDINAINTAKERLSEYSDRVKFVHSNFENLKEELAKLVRGVVINGYKTKPAEVEVIEYKKDTNTSLLRLIITEGKYHQVKNMCEAVGLPVKRLTRLRFATISTEGIAKGEYRRLKIHEVKQLYNL